jgi:Fic family protein
VDVQPDEAEKEALIARADSAYVPPPTFAEFMQTADVDLGPWERSHAELTSAREESPQGTEADSVTYLLRAAAVETGAIEGLYTTDRGFTFTVAEDTLAIEQLAVEKGEDFVRLFDAQLASFEMALDAATTAVPLSESWLRQLHEVTTAGQETYRVVTAHGVQERPLPRGAYKESPNHVLLKDGGTHSYAPVAETAREVRRVIEQLRTDEFQAADAIHQAAYAHYALVAVHPFSDGNGRVVRALASVFLLREASVPLFIYSDQTSEYFDALAASDAGDHTPFTRFIRDRAIAVARTAATAMRRTTLDPSITEVVRSAYDSPLGPPYEELDDLSAEIALRLAQHLNNAFERLDLPPQLRTHVQMVRDASGSRQPPEGWRTRTDRASDTIAVRVSAIAPMDVQVDWRVAVDISTGDDPVEAFRLSVPDGPDLLIGLPEASPAISHELDARLEDLAGQAASGRAMAAARAIQDAIERRGF